MILWKIMTLSSPSKSSSSSYISGAGGETVLLQQKSEVSAENISRRVRPLCTRLNNVQHDTVMLVQVKNGSLRNFLGQR